MSTKQYIFKVVEKSLKKIYNKKLRVKLIEIKKNLSF